MKRCVLVVLLIVFGIALTGAASTLINRNMTHSKESEEDKTKEPPQEESHEEDTFEEDTPEETIGTGAGTSENNTEPNDIEDDFGHPDDDDLEIDSREIVDLVYSVPCIKGNKNKLYPECDESESSNYGHEFAHLLTCGESTWSPEASFSLGKKYTTLSFTLGLWENGNEDTGLVEVYKGYGKNKRKIFTAKRSSGQREKEFSLDVSNVDIITIRLINPDFYVSYLVTDGFFLTAK